MSKQSNPNLILSIIVRAFVAIAILIIGGAIASYFIFFPPHTEKKNGHEQKVITVTTAPIILGDYPVNVEVLGQVIPARETSLKAQVSGEIVQVSNNYMPGGFFKKDDMILNIDPSDYELNIKTKNAALKQARASYSLEIGQQKVAKEEMAILERSTGRKFKNTDLALRKPQLEQARANMDAAQANLEIAELNLARTSIDAPFNSIMTDRLTDLGNVISAQSPLATLVSTDEYWIDIDVPLNHLPWLDIPNTSDDTGSKAVVDLGGIRGMREGYVLKQTGSVDTQSRLAGMLISVKDPLLLSSKESTLSPLILGDYVPVTIIGKTLKNSARIPQNYLHPGDTLWLAQGGKLVIQPVTVAYKDRKYAYITSGLNYAKSLITSNIITPVAGMDITVQGASPAPTKPVAKEQ